MNETNLLLKAYYEALYERLEAKKGKVLSRNPVTGKKADLN